MIEGASSVLAEWVVGEQMERDDSFVERVGAGAASWKDDTKVRLHQLAAATRFDRPALFAGHVAWMHTALAARAGGTADLRLNLECIREVLHERVMGPGWPVIAACLAAGARELDREPETPAGGIEGDTAADDLARRYLVDLLEGQRDAALRRVREALDSGVVSIEDVYLRVLQPVQTELGRMWHLDEIGVQEEHIVTAATQTLMGQIHERIERVPKDGRILLATSVAGDDHELGIRMIGDLFEMRGWRCVFLGANTPVADVAEAVKMYGPHLVALSANLALHLVTLRSTVSAVRAVAPGTPVIVGGQPFAAVEDLWQMVGADGGAGIGGAAVALGDRLVPAGSTG